VRAVGPSRARCSPRRCALLYLPQSGDIRKAAEGGIYDL
jgi:hypothetical protein